MTTTPNDARSSEDARQQAEHHRQQISDTLDVLSDRINDTVETAQRQINRPLNVVRAYPIAAFAASVAIGFVVAATATRRRRRQVTFAEQLANAYYEGRRDEQEQRSLRQVKYWQNREAREQPRLFRSTFFDLGMPLLRTIATRWASLIFERHR